MFSGGLSIISQSKAIHLSSSFLHNCIVEGIGTRFHMTVSVADLRRFADSEDTNSFANKLRALRFRRFEEMIAPLPRPLRVLDVGGTNSFWEHRGWAERGDVQITTLNIIPEARLHDNIIPTDGDATDLRQFADQSMDVVFSNSVIEHLFSFEMQRRMASEIQRVGKVFWVQTPNFWFPIEPHFHVPGWQWIPLNLRVTIIRRWRCGWRGPCSDPARARQLVEEVRLMRRRELKTLFPDAMILSEKFCGLTKSWIVVGGFERFRPF